MTMTTTMARAATPEELYQQQKVELQGDDVMRGGEKLALQQFLREAGHDDLAVRIDDAKGGGLVTGGVVGALGVLLGVAGWGAFVGFTVQSATTNNADLVAPALIGAFGGTCLCGAGVATGGGIAAYSQLVEPRPFEPGELQKVVDEHNAKLREQLGVPVAMVF